jgi:hypothetical protein
MITEIEMTEKKLAAKEAIKSVVFTVFAIMFFFVLWGIVFVLSLVFTLNVVLSLFLGLFISAVTTIVLITTLKPEQHLFLSKRQKIGAYIMYAIIFAFYLPLIQINPLLFLGILPILLFVSIIIIHNTLRKREAEGMTQK